MLPGIGPLAGISILLPVTFGLDRTSAIGILDGIGIVPVAVGLFGLGEILSTPSSAATARVATPRLAELMPTRAEWRESAMPIARGSLLGFVVGIVPGSAHIISSFLSYALERR